VKRLAFAGVVIWVALANSASAQSLGLTPAEIRATFKPQQVLSMLVLTALPFLAVIATEVPLTDILKQIASVLL